MNKENSPQNIEFKDNKQEKIVSNKYLQLKGIHCRSK